MVKRKRFVISELKQSNKNRNTSEKDNSLYVGPIINPTAEGVCTHLIYINEGAQCRINVKNDSTIQQMLEDALDSGFFGFEGVTTADILVFASVGPVSQESIVSQLRTDKTSQFSFVGTSYLFCDSV